MRRTELERQLRKLGWAPIGQRSGRGHMAWVSRHGRMSIPQTTDGDELIHDSVANDILTKARTLAGEDE